MTNKQLEQRLEQLEREVAELRGDKLPKKDWWKSWVGIATDDPYMKEAFRLALKYREDNRKEARRKDKGKRLKK